MQFSYVAYTVQNGIVKGHLEADTESDAESEVEEEGLKLLRIREARRIPGLATLVPSLFRVKTGELIKFSRQLATMLASGGNLLRVLDMLERESRSRVMRSTIVSIRTTLDDGGSLSEALAKHPLIFNNLFVSVGAVGEHTGRLGPALERLADIIEKDHEAKQKAIRTLMYPAAIIGLSAVTLGVLMTVALPPLLEVFENLGTEIPLMTKIVVATVGGVSDHFQKILAGMLAVVVAYMLLRRMEVVRYRMDVLQLRTPILGPFLISSELTRFSRTIAMLLEAGVTLANAIHLAKTSIKNAELRNAFDDAEESLLSGLGLSDALKRHKIMPNMFMELVMLGEESNSLERTMNDAANAYQKELEQKLDSLLGMLEPVSTVVVGGIVGIIAFSMFVPIYSGLNAVP